MQVFFIIIFVLYLTNSVFGDIKPEKYKLEQLQVLFRHGDRTPTNGDSYERDPYKEIYKSYGYGQLTKIGKERVYKIGQFLRNRYDDFLGEYKNDEVYAYSSDMVRTKMSLQLVLAGLYPPTPSTSWSDSVDWQPIPTHYESLNTSFLTATYLCPAYAMLLEKAANAPEISKVFYKYRDLLQRMTNHTGLGTSSLNAAVSIYSNFRSALSLGLPLPAWCSKRDFKKLERLSAVSFKVMTLTDRTRRMSAGPIVRRIFKVLNGTDSSKKIYLYSGHEFNVAAFVNAHNITGTPDNPDYGCALVLEKLRGSDDRSYVRMYLWTGVTEKFIFLKIDNCEKTCPLSDYEEIVQSILPNRSSEICTSRAVLESSNGIG